MCQAHQDASAELDIRICSKWLIQQTDFHGLEIDKWGGYRRVAFQVSYFNTEKEESESETKRKAAI